MPKATTVGPPDYLRKQDFGRVPAYLSEVKAEIAAEHEFIEGMVAQHSAVAAGPKVRSSDAHYTTLVSAGVPQWSGCPQRWWLDLSMSSVWLGIVLLG